jgi:hypothetical protein
LRNSLRLKQLRNAETVSTGQVTFFASNMKCEGQDWFRFLAALGHVIFLCFRRSVAIMPGLTPDFRRVSVARALAIDFDTPDLNHLFKLVFMVGDVRIKTENVGILGDIYVLDASVAVFKHFTKVSPMAIKKFFVCVQEAYPVKVKEVHIINATPFVDFVIKQVSFFLKEKIRRRIMVHPTVDSLLEFVPREMLPEEFGGTAGKMQKYSDQWIRMLQEYEPWFREQERVLADESKRPGPPKCHEDLFGLNGSFKQLAID